MIDFTNMVVIAICMFISGMAFHSGYLHAKEKYGWKFPWDHDEFKYNCKVCGYKTDSHTEFYYHSHHIDAGGVGTKREG